MKVRFGCKPIWLLYYDYCSDICFKEMCQVVIWRVLLSKIVMRPVVSVFEMKLLKLRLPLGEPLHLWSLNPSLPKWCAENIMHLKLHMILKAKGKSLGRVLYSMDKNLETKGDSRNFCDRQILNMWPPCCRHFTVGSRAQLPHSILRAHSITHLRNQFTCIQKTIGSHLNCPVRFCIQESWTNIETLTSQIKIVLWLVCVIYIDNIWLVILIWLKNCHWWNQIMQKSSLKDLRIFLQSQQTMHRSIHVRYPTNLWGSHFCSLVSLAVTYFMFGHKFPVKIFFV